MKLFWSLLSAALVAATVHGSTNEPCPEGAGTLSAFCPGTEERLVLPLTSTEVQLEVTAGVVSATVTQTFTNDTPHALEAIYIFPLPARAAVTDMELRTADRILRSVVQERDEAKRTYEQAKESGKKTALLEQERPNIFTTSVANFQPGESVSIRFTYMETADYQQGRYSISFPMVVGQRYIPHTVTPAPNGGVTIGPAVEDADRLNPPLLPHAFEPRHRLSLTATITGLPVRAIESNTHAIEVQAPARPGEPHIVTLARGGVIANADFNISIALRETDTPQLSFVSDPGDTSSYGLLTVFPPTREASDAVIAPRDVVFLIDTSGSMSGESIGQARSGLQECLGMLRPEDRFTIVRFASDYSFFAPDFRPAEPERIAAARGYIRSLSADGGTEMQKALEYVLTLPPADGHIKLVVFLTDGDVGNESALVRLLTDRLGRTRIFAFAIGSAPNEYLVRTMAEQGRGQARFIRSHEDIGTVMTDFFRTLEAPALTDIALTWRDRHGAELAGLSSFPSPCPDVFFQRPLQVIAACPPEFSGTITVAGQVNGQPVSYTYETQPSAVRHEALGRLYGSAQINNLMLQHMRSETPAEQQAIREQIIETALKHQLVSTFTSRVAVEEQITTHPDGRLETVKVQVPLPRGWDPSQFHATATCDVFLLVIGLGLLAAGLLVRGHRTGTRS